MRKIDLGLFLRLEGITRRPTHVGLPGAKPNFPNGHVFENDLVTRLDRDLVTGSCLGGVDCHHPPAVFPGGFGVGLAPACLDRDFFLRLGPTPYRVSCHLLEDHVIGKRAGKRALDEHSKGRKRESKMARIAYFPMAMRQASANRLPKVLYPSAE